MTSSDRTIYRHVKRNYTTKELIEAYTPTEEERRFVDTMTQTAQHQLNLMLWIKLFPCLGYFPAVDEIPFAIVVHVRSSLSLSEDLVPAYDHPRTLYRHQQLVREYYQIVPYGKDARRIALRTIMRAIRTMDNPADLINAAIDELVKQRYELPAGDLNVEGLERFADYRAQLLPWETCDSVAGKGGTMEIIARWPTPHPVGRDQSGPYAFLAMLVSLNSTLIGQNQFDLYDMKLRVIFLSNHSWNTLRVLIPESSHPSKITHHQPIPHHCGADHTPYPSAEPTG